MTAVAMLANIALTPGPCDATLATTTCAIIASTRLPWLFTLWTPSGIMRWRAKGVALCAARAGAGYGRGDLIFGGLPLTTLPCLGTARKPAIP
jgi:hypothetical protein